MPGEQIGYEVHPGPDGAPPLLLLHGFTASAASFSSNIETLREAFTVVTVELLGHGQSDAPETLEPYGPEPAVARITGLMDHLGFERAMLCGHSLGGALALRVALDAPERVAALVVINSTSAAGTPEWRRRAAAGLREFAARVRTDGIAFLRDTRLYPAASQRLPEDARELLTRDFERLTPAGVAGTALALTVPVNAYERLGELQAPTLVVIGDRDQDFVRSSIDFLDQLPPEQTSWVTLEGAGHAANLERPEIFNQAIIDFARDAGYLAALPVAAAVGGANKGPGSTTLTVIGGALIVAGVIMVAGAFLAGRDTDTAAGPPIPAQEFDDVTATPTEVELSAGISTPGPEFVTTTPAATETAQPASTEAPTTTPTAAATATPVPPEPTATQPVVVQPTQPPPTPADTPTPAPTATPTLSPTPAGSFAAISGPATAAVGETGYFVVASSDGALRHVWSNCSPGISESGCSRHFDIPGCVAVGLTSYFPDGAREAVHYVAVGEGSTCP